MSACNVHVDRSKGFARMLCDGASYDRDMRLVGIGQKAWAISVAQTAISSLGPVGVSAYLAAQIGSMFQSFDALIAAAETMMPEWFDDFAAYKPADRLETELHIVGWSDRENAPASYIMLLGDQDQHDAVWAAKMDATPLFKLKRTGDICGNPATTEQQRSAACLDFSGAVTELDLWHLLELQRQTKINGRYYVGGHVHLITITRDSITEKILHRYSEDVPGQFIEPEPITDWHQWRADREDAKVKALVPDGLSRLQRQRMEKKARKGTLISA